ncbi:type VII secretion protein EccB [Mycobacterium sp. 3519A]|uniref:type VII secretion protein EccB n=1 Tax=Mycobacterium sp. 3519A TaxID=2057184 RepID=UPI000C7A0DEC|nr:type VII secretion protein EccB [Mycobacterium sp. 3519A]
MPAQVTTRAQVNGYRFLIRRLEHALIRADSRMIHDPMRGQMRAMSVGIVIAVLLCGTGAVLAFMKPAPNFGNSSIMIGKGNGQLLVRIGDRLHPALNLASARLIAGRNDPPIQVDDKFINSVPLGPAVGIIGAPTSIAGGDDMTMSSWTVCDSTQAPDGIPTVTTSVLANDPDLDGAIHAASAEQSILAVTDGATYLIYQGVRASIDPANPIIRAALRLGPDDAREVSRGLLESFPLVDPISPITINGAGEQTAYLPPGYQVGAILQSADSRGSQLYVATREGLQPISAPAADIIRYGNPQLPTAAQPLAAALISRAPVVHNLPIDHYPSVAPVFIPASSSPVVCMSWQRGSAATTADTRLLVGSHLPLSAAARPVALATADGDGPGLDSVYVRPGTGEYVQEIGSARDSQAAGALFYVSDLGVRYHVADASAAAALGLVGVPVTGGTQDTPQPAPWAILSLLPPGPELSQRAALLAHDGMVADRVSASVTVPKS